MWTYIHSECPTEIKTNFEMSPCLAGYLVWGWQSYSQLSSVGPSMLAVSMVGRLWLVIDCQYKRWSFFYDQLHCFSAPFNLWTLGWVILGKKDRPATARRCACSFYCQLMFTMFKRRAVLRGPKDISSTQYWKECVHDIKSTVAKRIALFWMDMDT